MFTLLWVLVCILPTVFSYSPLIQQKPYFYQAGPRNPYTHQIWLRQIIEEDVPAYTWQRPARQTQFCLGPNRQRGRCVRLEDCVLRDLHLDYVKNREYFCVLGNQGNVGVCCPDSISSPVKYQEGIFTPTTPSNEPIMFEQQNQQPSVPNNPSPPSTNPDVSFKQAQEESYPLGDFLVCGRNGKRISSITTAAATTVKDWPWMAALVYRSTLKQFCGGTLITRRHVVTAAHCFPRADPNEVIVLLGDYDLKRPDESKSRAFSVIQLIIHEDFDVTTYENDITIMVLNSTTIYNSFIQPACLPPLGPRFINTTAVVTGWGKLEFGGRSPNVLMEVPVPIWDQSRCSPNFAQTVFDTNMCAGAFEGGKDACQGDSGGPLVMQRKDERWAIIGIVSWGIRCGEKDKPGVYTRVNDYLDWIAQAIL